MTNDGQLSTEAEDQIATILLQRQSARKDGPKVTDEFPALDVTAAYRVQQKLISAKVDAGERVVGVKLGLTSRAKQQRMGIDSPLTATITDRMVLSPEEHIPLNELIHPRIEPEIVFIMGDRLTGPGITATTAMAAVSRVCAGFEVIDSRFADFNFKLPDVVADNASSSKLYVSPRHVAPEGLDLSMEAVVLSVDGSVVDTATGAAVQGHPAEALALAANSLAARGTSIEAGDIVLTGGMTDAVSIHPGAQISAEFTHLGSLTVAAG